MKKRQWLALSGIVLTASGIALAISTFLPQRLRTEIGMEQTAEVLLNNSAPNVEVTFLCCGSNSIPAMLAVRGKFSLAPRKLAYSAVLVRHPQGTFLYDSGLCTDIQRFLREQPWWFQAAFSSLKLDTSIRTLLEGQGLKPQDLDFILLSHLHWDHVSGIPDLAGVPLRIHRIEYEAAPRELPAQHKNMVKRLLCDNPIELFDLSGLAYADFEASYDLFGDGSMLLVPLPGHTRGQVGLFIACANGAPLFLIADAAWLSENYLAPSPMHPFIWSILLSDQATATDTLIRLHHFAQRYPQIPMIAMHDAAMQEAFCHFIV